MNNLKWTNDVPTEDGWYWCDEPGQQKSVYKMQCKCASTGFDSYTYGLDEFAVGTRWYGPITAPE